MMSYSRFWIVALAIMLWNTELRVHGSDQVTINRASAYQSIRSWGAPSGLSGNPEALLPILMDELTDSMGLTRLRFEPPRRDWEDPLNDDADPFHATTAAFIKTTVDDRVGHLFLPFKQRVEARGEHFEFYVSPSFFNSGSSGSVPVWLFNSPGEYTEWASTFLCYLRDRYNLLADYYSICNEAGNNNSFSPSAVAILMKTLAPRLEALGFRTRFEFPECVSADTSWSYIQSTQNDSDMFRYVGLVSYHLYGGNTSRTNIRDFAWARGLPTAQSEYMGLNLNYLYDDLTLGGVSSWEFYALNDILPLNSSRTWFSRTQAYWQTRQVLHFVRPGSLRVATTSSTAALRALAFLRNGATTLVLINTTDGLARTVAIDGLTPGRYGTSQTVGSAAAQETGLIAADGTPLTVDLPANSALTLYPHPGTNLPPIVTDWKASPSYLTLPAGSTILSAAATDPETSTLSYEWSVLGSPPGSRAYLAAPQSASCTVTGLIAAGSYLFQVAISDRTNRVTRQLPLQVFSGNQPPELFDLHHRNPTTVILPVASTTLRCAGRDLEGDALTFEWSVAAQPAGATAVLLSPTNSSCVATNLTMPGDYLFAITLRDPSHSVSNAVAVTVYPVNRAPVIAGAAALPPSLSLPANNTVLSASTSDPDGDPVSHWWSVSSAPAGAIPVFSSQGSNITSVNGLIIPGTYAFTITAVDRAGVATRTINVPVSGGSSAPLLYLASPVGGETYTAGQTVTVRWSSFQVPGNVKLEFYNGETWNIIAASIPNTGAASWTVPHGNFVGCRLRVSAADSSVPAAQSAGTFSITALTPRFDSLLLTNGAARMQIEQEPGVANLIERTTDLGSASTWQTLVVLSNSAQSATWTDNAASNLPSAFYRVIAQ